MINKKPICACCNSDKYIHERIGKGYRCTRCNTIFDARGQVVGFQNMDPVNDTSVEKIFSTDVSIYGELHL
jgi:hypothetical protein